MHQFKSIIFSEFLQILNLNLDDDGELDLGQGALSNSGKVFRPDRDVITAISR